LQSKRQALRTAHILKPAKRRRMQLLHVIFGLSYARSQLSAAMHLADFFPSAKASRPSQAAGTAEPPRKAGEGFLAAARLEPHRAPEGSGIDDASGPPAEPAGASRPQRFARREEDEEEEAHNLLPRAGGRSPRISPLTNGRASRGSNRSGSGADYPLARDALAALALVCGLVAIGFSWVRPKRDAAIADEPYTCMLCGIQAAAAFAALCVLAQAMYANTPALRGLLILTDGLAHGALLVRGVLSVVEAKHTVAAQQYRRRLVAWSAWLDVRAQLSSVIAVVTWSTACIVLVLFVMVTMGGRALFPWAWWANHAVLSVACLALANTQAERHPAQPPVLALLADVVAGVLHGAPAAGGRPVPDLGICACALLLFVEALRGFALARRDAPTALERTGGAPGGQAWRLVVDRQLHATLLGNQDTGEFEAFLGRERRVCVFYAFQDLVACEGAASHAEMREKFAAWRSQFALARSPLHVPSLELEDAKCLDVCPQATVHKTKQALIGILREPYARYLSEKRRTLSATGGFQQGSKSREHPSLITAMRVPSCLAKAPSCLAKAKPNDEPATIV